MRVYGIYHLFNKEEKKIYFLQIESINDYFLIHIILENSLAIS
jgi:hypothetical protein